MQLCSCAVLQFCSFAVTQRCSYAVTRPRQHSNQVTRQSGGCVATWSNCACVSVCLSLHVLIDSSNYIHQSYSCKISYLTVRAVSFCPPHHQLGLAALHMPHRKYFGNGTQKFNTRRCKLENKVKQDIAQCGSVCALCSGQPTHQCPIGQ